jgi:MFS family permease
MQVPAVLGYLADYTVQSREHRMRIMSFYELATSGGIGVGVVLGGFIWDHFGKFSFVALASFYMIVAICMALAPNVKQVVERGNLRMLAARYWRIIHTPRLFIFIPAWISMSAIVGVWLSSQLPFILAVHRHNAHQLLVGSMSGVGSGGRLSLILGAFAVFFGLCLLFWAFFLNRLPRLMLMLTSIVGVYLFCIAMTGINHRGVGHDALLIIWVPVLLVGVFAETSFAPAALAYLADISESTLKDRGLIMGLYSVFLGLGQIFGSGLGGIFARAFDFDGLVYLTAILACIALVCLLYLHRYEKRHLSPAQQKPA